MTLVELREIAKEHGVKNVSKHKKAELIDMLKEIVVEEGKNTVKVAPASIEKDGVVLREKINSRKIDSEVIENKGNDTKIEHQDENRLKTVRIDNLKVDKTENQVEENETETTSFEEKREKLKEMIDESDSAKGVLELVEIKRRQLFNRAK
jgi:transcription termination factor Rho